MKVEYLNSKLINGTLNFEIKSDNDDTNIDKSIINSIRRVILSEIPTVGIEESNIKIEKNNTSLHNEYMSHRLSQIPLKIQDLDYNNDYVIILDVENKEKNISIDITTKNLKFYKIKQQYKDVEDLEISLDKYDLSKEISEKEKKTILNPFKFNASDNYILLLTLKNYDSDENQYFKAIMYPNIGIGANNSLYNNISTCSYSFHENKELLQSSLEEKLKTESIPKTELKTYKQDYINKYKERFYQRTIENEPFWYDFKIKSHNYYSSKDIFIYSLKILINKFENCLQNFKLLLVDSTKSRYSVTNKQNIYTFLMNEENDTLGNVLQSNIVKYLDLDKNIIGCGYIKVHPLEEVIKLIITIKPNISELQLSDIINELEEYIEIIINIYTKMLEETVNL
jgi:DNA-directed RNA polymerase subunit L